MVHIVSQECDLFFFWPECTGTFSVQIQILYLNKRVHVADEDKYKYIS